MAPPEPVDPCVVPPWPPPWAAPAPAPAPAPALVPAPPPPPGVSPVVDPLAAVSAPAGDSLGPVPPALVPQAKAPPAPRMAIHPKVRCSFIDAPHSSDSKPHQSRGNAISACFVADSAQLLRPKRNLVRAVLSCPLVRRIGRDESSDDSIRSGSGTG